ncbi:Ankyrin repeat family protein [Euphorbia peplus]|nr:Ankyrin repeat family protein [Euphorbia peplus]
MSENVVTNSSDNDHQDGNKDDQADNDHQAGNKDQPGDNDNQADVEKEDEKLMKYLPLYKAALKGDWKSAELIITIDKSALTAKLSGSGQAVLHAAVSTGHCNEMVRKLIEMTPEDLLGVANDNKETPLHYAAIAGNVQAIKLLVAKSKRLTQMGNKESGRTPLHYAAWYAQKECVSVLLQVTRDEDPSPFAGKLGVQLLNDLITADYHEFALYLLKLYPDLAVGRDLDGVTALKTLAQKWKSFPSGSNMGCCQRLLYHLIPNVSKSREMSPRKQDVENPRGSSEDHIMETKQHFRFLRHTYNTKSMHMQVLELLKLIISQVVKTCNYDDACEIIGPSVRLAATMGIHEFVAEIIVAFPNAAWLGNVSDKRKVLHLAVLNRQEKVFNILCQMSLFKNFVAQLSDAFDNNLLHLAGKLQPSSKISGAALQMQRELQWFKEVEKVVPPSYKEIKNKEEKTPSMLFTKEHEKLVEEGEKWMKKTAESCALVAALVVTVTFAAVFSAPGDEDNDGIPNFLKETSFLVFIVSNTFALFSSSTSLLMFLGILTSRYAEEDFLFALPMRLCIGLVSLFVSIASMLIAFTSSVDILVSHRVKRSWVPIGGLTLVPVTLFAMLQFPLLIQIVYSTFGPSIFRPPRNNPLISTK